MPDIDIYISNPAIYLAKISVAILYKMSGSALQYLFGPLSPEYCIWFYFLSIFSLFFFALAILTALFLGFKEKKTNPMFYFSTFLGSLAYAFFYFQNRLLYSMCAKAL